VSRNLGPKPINKKGKTAQKHKPFSSRLAHQAANEVSDVNAA